MFNPFYYFQQPDLVFTSLPSLVGVAFWVWMLIHCFQHDPDRHIWLWVLILLPPIGPFIYFFARWLPQSRMKAPGFLSRLTRHNELQRLQIAARQIGNAHQFVQLADAQRETGQYEQAADSYAKALEKDERNLPGLWGLAQVQLHWKQFAEARPRLEQVLQVDPNYKFGDVSMAYGKCLFELGENDAAFAHLTEHIKRWKTPQSQVLHAGLLANRGDNRGAREMLEGMILEVSGGPKFFRRQSARWVREGKRMLAKLPRS